MSDAIAYATIPELARGFRSGTLSPVQVTTALLARIEALNGTLNAFIALTPERALAEARAAEAELRSGHDRGPLHGIPYAVKDIFDVKNVPTTAGSRLLAENVADADCAPVARLAQAGMVLLGKTHTVQFALGPVGLNSDFGTPHNPWHRIPHAPGGSSSGSAVAVASGMVPMALGSDTGGSVRIPAGLCGIVGLKVTQGRISRAGVYPLSWTLDSVGPLTRGVEDAALVYLAMQGEDHRDQATRGIAPQAPLSSLKSGLRGLRLAVCATSMFEGAHPDVIGVFDEAVRDLRQLGVEIAGIDLPEVAECFADPGWGRALVAEGAHFNARLLDEHGADIDPFVRYMLEDGRKFDATGYFGAQWRMNERRGRLSERLRDVDVFLAPTVLTPAEPVSKLNRVDDYRREELRYWHNTAVANYFGLCAVSVPCGKSAEGLPIGLMFHGKPFQEELPLRAAHAYELASPWRNHHPDLSWMNS